MIKKSFSSTFINLLQSKLHLQLCLVFILILFSIFTGCKTDDSPQAKYQNNSDYFIGLQYLAQNDKDNAIRFLNRASQKADPLIARKAREEKAKLLSVQERIKEYTQLYTTYKDEDSLIQLCQELHQNKEYARIIQFTDDINLSECSNELARLRMNAMIIKNDSRFAGEFYYWCTSRSFTESHYKIYCLLTDPSPAIIFRATVYQKDYANACQLVSYIVDSDIEICPQLMSDIGKALLYGTDNYVSSAFYLSSIENKFSSEELFYLHFYEARLFDKTDEYKTRAMNHYKIAMEKSFSPATYDNALWYYFNAMLKSSVPSALAAIENYKSTIHDKDYFDDFFDTLSVRLLANHMWKDYYNTALAIDGYASEETIAKYSYITARLIEAGFLKVPPEEKDSTVKKFCMRCITSGSSFYYTLMASSCIGLSDKEIFKYICAPQKLQNEKQKEEVDVQAETLLCGYADFGLPQYIYNDWLKLNSKVSCETAEKISFFLRMCGKDNHDYYSQSLRIASSSYNSRHDDINSTLLCLDFPQDYHEQIADSCSRFQLDEYLFYGLVRSESFFDEDVVSWAGAVGLTQLMKPTAGDIAKKLKMPDYNLLDSGTNILFGSYYLQELIRRLDGSEILAVFAYNGGISRVRSWYQSANLEFDTIQLPKDIFLEALPFEETREYGRKVVSAAAMYAYLYYNKSFSETISELMK